MENLIGKAIFVDTQKLEANKNTVRRVVTHAKKIVEAYNEIGGLPKITQTIWDKIVQTDGQFIYTLNKEAIAEDLATIRSKFVRENLTEESHKAVTPFLAVFNDAKVRIGELGGTGYLLPVYLNDVKIINGKPEPDYTRITDTLAVKIETKEQATFYKAAKEFEKYFSKFMELKDSHLKRGYPFTAMQGDSLFTKTPKGYEFNPKVLANVE